MDSELQTIIKERFSTLTPEVKKAITDNDLPAHIESIASKNGLHIDQSGGLLTETYLVMLGMEKSETFAQNISKNFGVPLVIATTIANDVNREIFLPIRESLVSMSAVRAELEKKAAQEVVNTERNHILYEIENPTPTPERGAKPITDPAREIEARSATEGFVASKLANSSVSTRETAVVKESPAPKIKPGPDPYREPLQ